MSLFSYISFPRAVDIRCLSLAFDKMRAFTVGEINGTEMEKLVCGSISDSPDNLSLNFSESTSNLLAAFQGVRIYENRNASLSNIFTNPFAYCLEATFDLIDIEEYFNEVTDVLCSGADNDVTSYTEGIDFAHKLVKHNIEDVALCRKQLAELIKHNTRTNEIVEIYAQWVSGFVEDYNFGPAERKVIITLEQVPNSDFPVINDKTLVVIQNI